MASKALFRKRVENGKREFYLVAREAEFGAAVRAFVFDIERFEFIEKPFPLSFSNVKPTKEESEALESIVTRFDVLRELGFTAPFEFVR